MPEGALIKATIAARRLGVCSVTVRNWIKKGRISGLKMGRNWYVHRKSLDEILQVRASDSG